MNIDLNYINDLESIYGSSLKRYSIQELTEIFPEAIEVLREKILETVEELDSARERVKRSYTHSLRDPEAVPICEATSEIIYENEIVPSEKRLKRLTYQHYILTNKGKKEKEVDIDSLKEKLDLRIIAETYGIKLRRTNKKYSMGLCPFHSEKHPSFSISEKYFHCFGCQKSGDVFNFIQEVEGVDFKKALNTLLRYE